MQDQEQTDVSDIQSTLQSKIDHFTSVDQYWSETCAGYGDQVAYTNMGSSLTYAELDEYARHFAAYLQSCRDLEPGDRIAVQLPNVLQYPVVVQAIWRAGMVVVNTNPLYTVSETIRQFEDAGVKAVIILANNAASMERVLPCTSIKRVIVTQLADLHPLPRRMYINLAARFIRRIVPRYSIKGVVHFRDALLKGSHLPFRSFKHSPDQTAMIQYTVGTTGKPKGAVLSHKNLIANVHQITERFNQNLNLGTEIAIAPLPLYHIYSFAFHCLFLPSYGAHIVLITNPADTSGFVNELSRWRFTVFSGLNSLFVALCQHHQFRQLDMSSLKLTFSGGMALTQSVSEEWRKITGCDVVQGYGLTEASPVIAVGDPENYEHGTVGAPLVMTQVRIVSEQGDEMCSGEYGEIQVKGPQVMSGYWRSDSRVLDHEGWLATGDIGRFTEQGVLKIVERKRDIIHISGFPVYPNELENTISCHPDIRECVVIGLPDDESGQVIKLFVVTANHQLSVKQIRDYCRERLTFYKVPRLVEFRAELPKSNVGKILRRKLLEEELMRINKLRKHI